MIDIKSPAASGVRSTGKADKKKATGSAGGPSFSSFLDDATGVGSTAVMPGGGFAPVTAFHEEQDQADTPPRNAKEKGQRLLRTLNQLAQDAMSGSPTAALGQLQHMLASGSLDKTSLTPAQQQALDEVETRAAVEAEKLAAK